MKRLLRNIFWILGLLILCVPAGYFIAFIEDKRFVPSEFVMNLILGGIAMAVVLSVFCLPVYIVLKVRGAADPLKPTLRVFSVLVILLLIVAGIRMPSAIKERDRKDFLEDLKETLTTTYTKKISEMPDAPAELKEHAQEVAICIYYEIKSNEELVDQMMTTPDPKNFTATSPEIKKMVEKCFSLYMDSIPNK
ncbi:MAG: hypothetical protein ABIQ40_18445 [Bacteroidia bacterium]